MIPKAQQDALDNRAERVTIGELLKTTLQLLPPEVPERSLVSAALERLWGMKR